jgi:hypothetical protein
MIADFSSVLLDLKDKSILVSRPIEPKIINIAKLIHIVIYLVKIAIVIAGPPLIVGLFRYGVLFFLLFFIEVVLICIFTIFFTSVLYFAILLFFDGEKLKDIINYFQILLSTFMIVAYQFVGRIFNIVETNIKFEPKWWNFLVPSTWFAAPFNLFIEGDSSEYFIALSILGLVIPMITLVLYITAVTPFFEKKLQKLNNVSSGKSKRVSGVQKAIATLVCNNRTERIFYLFTQNMISSERKIKLRLYPNLAFGAVLPFIMVLGVSGTISLTEIVANLSNGKYYLAIYITVAFLPFSILMLSMSEKYKGSWIYRALPLDSPSHILCGVLKGFLLKYIVPVFLLVSVGFTAIYGIALIPHLILMFINMIFVMLLIFRISKKELPFSKEFQVNSGGSFSVVVLAFLISGLLCLLHFALLHIWFGLWLNIAVSIIITWGLWRKSFNISWKDISG